MKLKIVFTLLVIVFMLQITACGSLIYPQRHGQTSGRIDPAIAILDGAGILLFVIPGLIAFAVDFATGAIYLPSEKAKNTSMRLFRVGPTNLTKQNLESILSEHTGQLIRLNQKKLRLYRLV